MTSRIAEGPISPFDKERAGAISSGAEADAGQESTETEMFCEHSVVQEEETFGFRKPRIPRRPLAPTKADVDEHMPLHVDYRDWCAHCVAGKGISHQHTAAKDTDIEKLGATVSMDYCFWVPEEIEDDMCPVLVAYEDTTKALWVLQVEEKGADHLAVNYIADKLEHYGFSGCRITIKSDQERSIMNCKRGIALKRKAPTALIESPIRESKSNGAVEGAVRRWRNQFKTLRHHLEHRLQKKIPKDSPLMSWLITWAGEVLCKFKVQNSGRTTHEMATGHKCSHLIVGFGEKVHFKVTTDIKNRNKMETEWGIGYFLGVMDRNTQYVVFMRGQLYTCTTLKRMLDDEAYDPAIIEDVTLTFDNFIAKGAENKFKPDVIVVSAGGGVPDSNPVKAPGAPRRVNIRKADLQKYGFTAGCVGCQHAQMDLPNRVHTDECRQRVTQAMESDDTNKIRLERAKDRQDQYFAKVIEDSEAKLVELDNWRNSLVIEDAPVQQRDSRHLDVDASGAMHGDELMAEEEVRDNV